MDAGLAGERPEQRGGFHEPASTLGSPLIHLAFGPRGSMVSGRQWTGMGAPDNFVRKAR
jgi:hypothetical protein